MHMGRGKFYLLSFTTTAYYQLRRFGVDRRIWLWPFTIRTFNDLATINNKVIVGDYFDTQIYSHSVQFRPP